MQKEATAHHNWLSDLQKFNMGKICFTLSFMTILQGKPMISPFHKKFKTEQNFHITVLNHEKIKSTKFLV